MKDWINNLDDQELTRLFKDAKELPEVSPHLRKRVLDSINDRPAQPAGDTEAKQSRRFPLKPVLALTAAAAVLIIAFLVARPLLMPADAGSERVITQRDLDRGAVSTSVDRAFITYLAGRVEISTTDGGWRPANLGTYLSRGRRIRVGEASSCEIQFGDRAVARLRERTEVSIRELTAASRDTAVELAVDRGTVLNKVSRLTGAETYRVKTKTAMCGVRGTEFSVTAGEDDETVLAVREGSVYLLPPSIDLTGLYARSLESHPEAADRILALQRSAPAVTAGREAVVTRLDAAAIETDAYAVTAALGRALSGTELSADELARLDRDVAGALVRITTQTPPRRGISAAREEELKELHRAVPLPVSLGNGTETPATDAQNATAAPSLVKIEVATDPEDASIFLPGYPVCRGRLQGIFREGTSLPVKISKPGFEEKSLTVSVSQSGRKSFMITLQPQTAHRPEAEMIPELKKGESHEASAVQTPSVSTNQADDTAFIDDFNTKILNSRWRWVRENTSKWTLRQPLGSLTIKSERGDLWEGVDSAKNILLTTPKKPDFIIETKLTFSPQAAYKQAGLIVYSDDDNYIKVDAVYNSGLNVEMVWERSRKAETQMIPMKEHRTVFYLRLEKKGDTYTCWFSPDGKEYTLIHKIILPIGNNPRVGLYAINGDIEATSIPARFDYFRLEYTDK